MSEFIPYMVKFSIIFAVLLTFFAFALRKETLHYLKRLVLLTIPVLSFFLPLINFKVEEQTIMHRVMVSVPEMPLRSGGIAMESRWDWQSPVLVVIGLVGIVLLVVTLNDMVKIFRIIRSSRKKQLRIGVLCDSERPVSPFSFFDFIVLHSPAYSDETLCQVIEHEQVHVYQKHSVDMLTAQLICIVFWWNPLVWIYRHLVIENLEFIVDRAVLKAGMNKKKYQLSILSASVYASPTAFANHFNYSLIKKRIQMMNKKLSRPANMWKTVLILPLAFLLWICFGQATVLTQSPSERITTGKIEYPLFYENDFMTIELTRTKQEGNDLFEMNVNSEKGSLYARKSSTKDVVVDFIYNDRDVTAEEFMEIPRDSVDAIGTLPDNRINENIILYVYSDEFSTQKGASIFGQDFDIGNLDIPNEIWLDENAEYYVNMVRKSRGHAQKYLAIFGESASVGIAREKGVNRVYITLDVKDLTPGEQRKMRILNIIPPPPPPVPASPEESKIPPPPPPVPASPEESKIPPPPPPVPA
ncbi:M56 family metallopeptidase, partial [Membranihabitans maritimus]|uniref:M56 family metallopeptidase n=1 Tax=Membranihabitans maritimus TaxID=2904244 RepID=UPI001F373DC6